MISSAQRYETENLFMESSLVVYATSSKHSGTKLLNPKILRADPHERKLTQL